MKKVIITSAIVASVTSTVYTLTIFFGLPRLLDELVKHPNQWE